MPSDFGRTRYAVPKYTKSEYRTLMKTLETSLGFGASHKAQFKLRCLELLDRYGWDGVKTAFPHVSRATVYRWHKQFHDSGRKLNILVPRSTRPHKVRSMQVSSRVLLFIKQLRLEHPHLSKYKLKVFVDEWCQIQGLPTHSVSWIGKVITRNQLFFTVRKPIRKKRRVGRSGYTIKRTPNPKTLTFGYLQLDGITIYWSGSKLTFLTALELKTRKAWVRLVPTISSFHAKELLTMVINDCGGVVHTIHTDNGSEFHALFDQVIKELNLLHLWSPPRTPKVHSHIERFNGIIQEEFINYHLDEAVVNQHAFKNHLKTWLTWYNTKRPHHSLNLLNPQQYLLQLLNKKKGDESLKCL